MTEEEPMPKAIAITVDQSDDGSHFDFTYVPTTVHLRPGAEVSFRIEGGKVDSLLLVFERSPFRSGHREIPVSRTQTTETIGKETGVFHYKSLDGTAGKGRYVYDIWCPSIIVD
jgi:hypothetical protein